MSYQLNLSNLYADLEKVFRRFPKLNYSEENGKHYLDGNLDICGIDDSYFKTYSIHLEISDYYPFYPPKLFETSNLIFPRNETRHISYNGLCCVEIEHKLLYLSSFGMSLNYYISNFVYPYFSNQSYYDLEGQFAGFEYKHQEIGITQFYQQVLDIHPNEQGLLFLKRCIDKNKIEKYARCPCGKSLSFMHCHLVSWNFIQRLSTDTINRDFTIIEEYLKS